MTEESTQGEKTWSQQLSARASMLTEKGAHSFVGWLIRAGVGNPEMLGEYERALNKVERDPNLQYCRKDGQRPPGQDAAK